MPENKFKLKFTKEAQSDLFEIFDHIANNLAAPIAAGSLIDKIEKASENIALFPYAGSIPNDGTLAKKGYRLLVVDNFIIFYQVDEAALIVKVIRVVYGKSNYQQFL